MSTDERRADFRTRASAILASLVATGGLGDREQHQEQWGRMWDLLREAIASGADFQLQSPPTWEYRPFEVDEAYGVIRQQLTSRVPAGAFELLVSYPPEKPEESFLATDLPRFLDWAGVPVPENQP